MKKKTVRKPLSEEEKERRQYKRDVKAAAKQMEELKETDPADYRATIRDLKKKGTTIEVHRKKAKMSVTELAEKADLDKAYLKGILKGQINMLLSDMLDLSKVLGVKIAVLVNTE